MKFEEWLQMIFLPKLLEAENSNIFPKKSQVAIAAIRNFDGMDEVDNLISLLGRVDEIINSMQT
ncbi:MAG: YqcC family protein [Fibrobacteria bacterium]